MQDSRESISFDEIDKDGPQSYHRTVEVPLRELDRVEVSAIGPITIDAKAEKGDLPGEYLIEGTTQFTADFHCSRCIEPYPFANTSPFQLRFRPRPEAVQEGEEIEIAPDELDVEFYSERSIPLKDLAIEQIQLAIPMKPLCDETCAGLCPHCGVNRNRERCTCDESMTDERWGALAGIREQLAKKKNV
jgi:uncharacterized protein